ncbi:hypothetical protein HMPREF0733_12179 [Rothia dentocariosa ATCC 17931]|uniref:Uncharacterized protein n=1 Tax=Rothia dentocariosa (strain ATCC 17931 / CDC X599 / XDIA) TaxID=762948 RepID=E3H3R7_ROTDC|nr:hypothetical protein HMPREF0733_12179 [Rothia dentocariosa ATCC 17931]
MPSPNGVHSEVLEAGYKFWADFCDDHLKVRSCMMQQSTGIVITRCGENR